MVVTLFDLRVVATAAGTVEIVLGVLLLLLLLF